MLAMFAFGGGFSSSQESVDCIEAAARLAEVAIGEHEAAPIAVAPLAESILARGQLVAVMTPRLRTLAGQNRVAVTISPSGDSAERVRAPTSRLCPYPGL